MGHEHLPSAEHSLPPGVCTEFHDGSMENSTSGSRSPTFKRGALRGSEAQSGRQLLFTRPLREELFYVNQKPLQTPFPGLHESTSPVSRATLGCFQPTPGSVPAQLPFTGSPHSPLSKAHHPLACPGPTSLPNPTLPVASWFSLAPWAPRWNWMEVSPVFWVRKPTASLWFSSSAFGVVFSLTGTWRRQE